MERRVWRDSPPASSTTDLLQPDADYRRAGFPPAEPGVVNGTAGTGVESVGGVAENVGAADGGVGVGVATFFTAVIAAL